METSNYHTQKGVDMGCEEGSGASMGTEKIQLETLTGLLMQMRN